MPASLLCDFDNGNGHSVFGAVAGAGHHHQLMDNLDQRSFDLALELNWLNLGGSASNNNSESSPISNNITGCGSLFSSSSNTSNNISSLTSSTQANNTLLNALENDTLKMATMAKRSQNTTECVPVPSSEHVAEIVGRQGCKIKALRAKTNTYIKTPVRGEEPVFVVTGRKEDVNAAKREILSAAEHFSQIRAQRKNNPSNLGMAPNAHLPGHVTIQVRVPYRVVGLVVGPKGATIKRIQQQTNTYIITPSRDKDPVFEVTGLPDDVETARKEIEAHIAIRTGGIIDSTTGSIGTPEESTSDFSNSPLLPPFDNLFSSSTLGSALTKQNTNDYFVSLTSKIGATTLTNGSLNQTANNNPSTNSQSISQQAYKDLCSLFQNNATSGNSSGKNTSNGSYDTDEGIGDSPTFDILASGNFNSIMWSTDHSSYPGDNSIQHHQTNNYIQSQHSYHHNNNNNSASSSLSNRNLESICNALNDCSTNNANPRRSNSLESSIHSTSTSPNSSSSPASTSPSSSCVSISAPTDSSI